MTDFASAEQLAQLRPASTTPQSAFTAALRAEITRVVICNTTNQTVNYSLYHDDDGSAFNQGTALAYQVDLLAHRATHITASALGAGLTVKPGGQLGVQSSAANALTFTLYGVTEAIAHVPT